MEKFFGFFVFDFAKNVFYIIDVIVLMETMYVETYIVLMETM